MNKISIHKLQELIKQNSNIHLIDVRTPIEFASGHLPESINFPLEEMKHFNFPKHDNYYFICHSGFRSYAACRQLIKRGYQNITQITDGLNNWQGEIEANY